MKVIYCLLLFTVSCRSAKLTGTTGSTRTVVIAWVIDSADNIAVSIQDLTKSRPTFIEVGRPLYATSTLVKINAEYNGLAAEQIDNIGRSLEKCKCLLDMLVQ